MARSNEPDSASSQFFIVQADSTYLDGQYAAFGKVTKGMDIVDKICKDTPVTDSNGTVEKKISLLSTQLRLRKIMNGITVLVDADACPVVKSVERIAKNHNVPVVLLCDTNHVLKSDYSEIKLSVQVQTQLIWRLSTFVKRATLR